MKIAIATGGCFTDRWIERCQDQKLDFNVVEPYDSDLVSKLRGYTHFLWHWSHFAPEDQAFARQLLISLSTTGIKVFPDIWTCWHFDDKVGQKYLLECAGLPLVQTWAFYSRERALEWAATAEYPVVFKLRSGAGSKNVKLVKDKKDAKRLIVRMFSKGMASSNVGGQVAGTVRAIKRSPWEMLKKFHRIPHYIRGIITRKMLPLQVGYCLFQKFIAGNTYDTRIVVVGNRAIGIRRMVRKNDFRASGSGMLDYDYLKIDLECVRLSFEVAQKIKAQSLALDFVRDSNGKFWIVEISYGYSVKSYYKCPGYWDSALVWHNSEVYPEDWILEDLISDDEKQSSDPKGNNK